MVASAPTYLSPRMGTVIAVAAHHFDAIARVVRSDLGEAGSEASKPDPAFRVPAPIRSNQPVYPTRRVKGDGARRRQLHGQAMPPGIQPGAAFSIGRAWPGAALGIAPVGSNLLR